MSKIISALMALLFFFSLSAFAESERLNIASLRTGEYVLIDSSRIVSLPVCAVNFFPKLYLREMIDGISDKDDERLVRISGRKIEFISSHPQGAMADSLDPFNPREIVLSELIYIQDAGVWRRCKDVPLSVETVAWGQRVSVLSPNQELKHGTRYALFFGNTLAPYGTVLPLDEDLRAGVYYFIISGSEGQ